MKKDGRLQGKDFINIGIFTAIYFVIVFAVACLGFIPIMMPFLAVLVPLIAGVPFMLYLTKARKFGMLTIMGMILGIIMMLMGPNWPTVITGTVFGLLADLLMKSSGYQSVSKSVLANGIFSCWVWGQFIPMYINTNYYDNLATGYGQEYTQTLQGYMQPWVLPVLLVVCFVFGLLGGLLGKAILRKHFLKAGMA